MPQRISKGLFTVSVEYGPSIVLVACSGAATVTEICGALGLAGEIARRGKRHAFLFDLLSIDFAGTDQEREEIGMVAASLLSGMGRIAVVLSNAMYNGVGARMARDVGLQLCNFDNLAAAMDWLDD